MVDELVKTVIDCSIDKNELVIEYQENAYHLLCGETVFNNPHSGPSFCIKRLGHLSNVHEDWLGQTTMAQQTIEGL